MEPNNFEKDFREKLNQRKIEPSDKAWDRLDAMLSVAENKKPKKRNKWLYIAASLVGFLLVGTIYFNRFETVGIKKDVPIVLEQKTHVDTLDKPGIIEEDVVNSRIQKKIIRPYSDVADINNETKQSKRFEDKEVKVSIVNHLKKQDEAVASLENRNQNSTAINKYISAEKLLAEVSDTKFEPKVPVETIEKRRKAIAVSPNDLLLNAETELNKSFRESALDRFNKNLKAVKTAIVNRNYEE